MLLSFWKTRWLIFCHDLCWVPIAVLFSFYVRFNFEIIPEVHSKAMLSFLLCAILVQAFSYAYFKLARGVWHYTSLRDLIRILQAVAVGVFVTFVLLFVVMRLEGVPRSVLLLYPLFLVVVLVTPRMVYRWLKDQQHAFPDVDKTPTLLIGAGRAGDLLLRDMLKGREYLPMVILDDDKSKHGHDMHGVHIVGGLDCLESCVHDLGIGMVMLSITRASGSLRDKIVVLCNRLQVQLLVLPNLQQLANGQVKTSTLREASIDDLLGRGAVAPQVDLLCASIRHRSVLVTGAGGSIGSELCRQILMHAPTQLVLLELNEFVLYQVEQELSQMIDKQGLKDVRLIPLLGSITNQGRVEKICKAFEINTIYHAAAYKHVPLVENNVIEAIQNNVFGTLALVKAAMLSHVDTFVLISTDKAVRPTNVMGASKRLAEMILQAMNVQSSGTRFCMVRFGNVLGSSGSVVPLFRQQIKKGGPITVTHPEVTRYFMTIPEAAQLVLQASSMAQGGDVFVLDMGESVKIIDLAHKMIHLSGLSVKDAKHPEGDIAIEISGLRSGEKLYEELLIGDCVVQTQHPLIMRASEEFLAWDVLDACLIQLSDAMSVYDMVAIRQLLIQLVSGYQPVLELEDFS